MLMSRSRSNVLMIFNTNSRTDFNFPQVSRCNNVSEQVLHALQLLSITVESLFSTYIPLCMRAHQAHSSRGEVRKEPREAQISSHGRGSMFRWVVREAQFFWQFGALVKGIVSCFVVLEMVKFVNFSMVLQAPAIHPSF